MYVSSHPKRESSPNTAAPSTIHWASVVRGNFFCLGKNHNQVVMRVNNCSPESRSNWSVRTDVPRAIWLISCLNRCLVVPADRQSVSYVCYEKPALPGLNASPPESKISMYETYKQGSVDKSIDYITTV